LQVRGRSTGRALILRGGAAGAAVTVDLRLRDIDARRATVWLNEENRSDREQPISPTLFRLLERHATTRGARYPDDPVFRRHDGTPITARRYNTIFHRARQSLGWAQGAPVSAHVLRHTAITAVARLAGYPVAQTFAGHTPPSITGRYMQASLTEVATTIAALTGEPHPLASSISASHVGRQAFTQEMNGNAISRASARRDLQREVRWSVSSCRPHPDDLDVAVRREAHRAPRPRRR
jgi:hypothetical protein